MTDLIKSILNSCETEERKVEQLDELEQDIKLARKVLSGEYAYCEECDDYYRSQSFTRSNASEIETVCTFEDPINSGGNEYSKAKVSKTLLICPKGHERVLNKTQTLLKEGYYENHQDDDRRYLRV